MGDGHFQACPPGPRTTRPNVRGENAEPTLPGFAQPARARPAQVFRDGGRPPPGMGGGRPRLFSLESQAAPLNPTPKFAHTGRRPRRTTRPKRWGLGRSAPVRPGGGDGGGDNRGGGKGGGGDSEGRASKAGRRGRGASKCAASGICGRDRNNCGRHRGYGSFWNSRSRRDSRAPSFSVGPEGGASRERRAGRAGGGRAVDCRAAARTKSYKKGSESLSGGASPTAAAILRALGRAGLGRTAPAAAGRGGAGGRWPGRRRSCEEAGTCGVDHR